MKPQQLLLTFTALACLLGLAGCGGPSMVEDVARYQPAGMLGMGELNTIAYSPKGAYLAAVSPRAIILYDPTTLTQLNRFETDIPIMSLAFTPDESKFVAGTTAGSIEERDMKTGAVLRVFGKHRSDVVNLKFSRKGSYMLSWDMAAGRTVHLWDANTGSEIRSLSQVWKAAISPDENLLAIWKMNASTITFEGVRDGKFIGEAPLQEGLQQIDFAFSPDGQSFAYATEGEIKVINMTDFSPAASFPYDEDVNHLTFSPDGKRLAITQVGYSVDVFDTASWSPLVTLNEDAQIWNAEFTADSNEVLTYTDKFIRFWDPQNGEALVTLAWQSALARQMDFTAQGETLLSSSTEGVQEWRTASGELMQDTFVNSDLGSLAIYSGSSPDGKLLATAMWMMNRTILWDGVSGSLLTDLSPQDNSSSPVNALAFSADGNLLAVGYESGLVEVWNMGGGRLLEHSLKSDLQVTSTSRLAFSPDGKSLAAAYTLEGNSSSIGIWTLPGGTLKTSIDGPISEVTSLAYAPNGRLLAAGAENHTASIWKASNGKLVANLVGHASPVNCLAFSPDSSVLASGTGSENIDDNKIRFWNASDGALLHTLEGQQGKVMSVAFSPDGQYFASGSLDGTILLWKLELSAP